MFWGLGKSLIALILRGSGEIPSLPSNGVPSKDEVGLNLHFGFGDGDVGPCASVEDGAQSVAEAWDVWCPDQDVIYDLLGVVESLNYHL